MTGSIQNPAVKVFENYDDHRLQMSAVNDSGGNLVPGMEVIFKANGTIDKRTLGTQIPIGIVMIGSANGKRATVRLYATALMNAVATGGNLSAGVFVVPNGNIDATYETPEVVAASQTNEVLATGSFTVTGGTNSAGVNKVSAVLVNGVDILGSAVDWSTSHAATAAAIAAQINNYESNPNYTASAVGAVVTIRAVAGSGNTPNGFVVSPTVAGDVTVGSVNNMAGGVNSAGAWVSMIVVKGANQDLPIKVAVLNAPHQLNPAP